MNRSQDIYFGVLNQRLVWDAPEGRPTVASAKVFRTGTGDEGTEELAVGGSVAIDAASTTVDDDSGDGEADPRLLNVAATDDLVVGQSYLLAGAGGKERIEVVSITAGASVRTRYPMANAYVSGATLVGTRISALVSPSWVQDSSKLTGGRDPIPGYRVRWLYTVAGLQVVHDCAFDLVRYAGGHTLTAVDADREFPGIKGMTPNGHRGDDLRALIDQAYQRVRWDLTNIGVDDNAVLDQDAINRATLLSLGILISKARTLQGADSRVLEQAERDYGQFMSAIFRVGEKVAIATDSSGAGRRATADSIFEK